MSSSNNHRLKSYTLWAICVNPSRSLGTDSWGCFLQKKPRLPYFCLSQQELQIREVLFSGIISSSLWLPYEASQAQGPTWHNVFAALLSHFSLSFSKMQFRFKWHKRQAGLDQLLSSPPSGGKDLGNLKRYRQHHAKLLLLSLKSRPISRITSWWRITWSDRWLKR